MTGWLQPRRIPDLGHNDVHIWRMSLDLNKPVLQKIHAFLNEQEKKRADRFRFEKDRQHFIAARGQMKFLLGEYLMCNPDDIHLHFTEYGKPYLEHRKLYFNISHSHKLALLAIRKNYEVGIDIEWKHRNIEPLKIAGRFFSQVEQDELFSLNPKQQTDGFFKCWSSKEAFIKAVGLGLSMPLRSFDVVLNPEREANLLDVRHSGYAADNWQLFNIDTHNEYASAIVVQKPVNLLLFWDLSENLFAN
ncbi:MAG: 4'-phosphopantetheinyl transferase superfamily protein [Caldithrix sp.]|nr:4'-phosphopantetheinyl transferase superfamily protein [Caldithrix sp.]